MPGQKNLKKTALFCFSVVILLFTSSISQVAATDWYTVRVLVAYDEEFDCTARWRYAYSPETLARIIIDEVEYCFMKEFYIEFAIIGYTSWDSDDSVTNRDVFMNETIAETNFTSGMYVNGKVVDVLVAFSNQGTIGCYGYSDKYHGVAIAMETWYFAVGQCTDNVLQHELSHLYWVPDHDVRDLDCVMNRHLVHIPLPWDYYVPTTLLTNNWCDDCKSTINANKTLWGTPHEGGGGGGLRYFDTYSAPNGNCSE